MKKYLFPILMVFLACGCSPSEQGVAPTALTDKFSSAPSGGGSGGNGNGPEAGVLTAGEWNDLHHWDFWQNLLKQPAFAPMPALWKINPVNRVAVQVHNPLGQALADVPVDLLAPSGEVAWSARTDHAGRAELWAYLLNDKGAVSLNGFRLRAKGQLLPGAVKAFPEGANTLVVAGNNPAAKKLEVAFVVDATGSMGDELQFLKTELLDVINRIRDDNPGTAVQLGSVFYRDQNDAYLTRRSGFSADIGQTIHFIKAQEAGGGGDFPEAVHTALKEAVEELQWSDQATSRILFLILDAPPHQDTPVFAQIQAAVAAASRKGIRIIPITASGIDKTTEALMRLMAISTNGTYVFITDHSGVGNAHLEASVGDYQVEYLNDLMVRLLNESLK